MKKIRVEVEVPYSFEKGSCESCPFSYTQTYDEGDGYYDMFDRCILESYSDECPIQFIEENI